MLTRPSWAGPPASCYLGAVAGKNPTLVKRDRERARTEKAARKREERERRKDNRVGGDNAGPKVATRQDLDGYGLDRGASGDPFEGRES